MTKEKAFEIIDKKWGFNLDDTVYIPKTHYELSLQSDGITITDGKTYQFFAYEDIYSICFRETMGYTRFEIDSHKGSFFHVNRV